jgi:hypothetical protein
MTHPHLQVRKNGDANEAAPGHVIPTDENTDNVGVDAVMALLRHTVNAQGNPVQTAETLEAYRGGNNFKHCEILSREECQERNEGVKFTSNAGTSYFSECVASSLVPGQLEGDAGSIALTNPLMMFSPAYIADKTGDDLDINQAICRWSGSFDADEAVASACHTAYQFVRDGHHNYNEANEATGATGTHTGYKYRGANAYAGADMNGDPEYNEDVDCDDVDCDDLDVSTAANRGGQYWLRVGEQNRDIQKLRNVHSDELLPEDIEAVSVAALAYYATKLSQDSDYNSGADTPLTDDQKEHRRVLLEAIPGECFSAGISDGLLYSGGWGAAYFSLGLLLVIAHFVWFYAAMSDDKEGLRFMVRGAGRPAG